MKIFPVKFKLSHNGVPLNIQTLRWLPKTGQYQVIGRNDRLSKNTIYEAQDQVSEKAWQLAKELNRRLRRQEITIVQWQQELLAICEATRIWHDFVCNGGLAKESVRDAVKDITDPPLYVKRLVYKEADEGYIAFLSEEVTNSHFGPNFEFGDFDFAVQSLFLEGLENFSPDHDPEIVNAKIVGVMQYLELEVIGENS